MGYSRYALHGALLFLPRAIKDSVLYWAVCIPVVAMGAPIGAYISSHLHRQIIATFVYTIDVVQYIGAIIIVPMTLFLWQMSIGIIIVSVIFFSCVTKAGAWLLEHDLAKNAEHQPLLSLDPEKEEHLGGSIHNGYGTMDKT